MTQIQPPANLNNRSKLRAQFLRHPHQTLKEILQYLLQFYDNRSVLGRTLARTFWQEFNEDALPVSTMQNWFQKLLDEDKEPKGARKVGLEKGTLLYLALEHLAQQRLKDQQDITDALS